MNYNFARKRYYVEMFNYVWSMNEADFEQLLLDGASGMYDAGLRGNWEDYYNAKLLRGMKRGGEYETRNIFHLLDADREDFQYALDDFNSGYY